MGISYGGGMLVGCEGLPPEPDDWDEDESEEWYEHLEGLGIESYSQYYDADYCDCYFGFPVGNCLVENIDQWIVMVKDLAKEFEDITGVKAELVGTQNIN
jgi:hypothetical protein